MLNRNITFITIVIYAFCCGATFYSPILRVGKITFFDILSFVYVIFNFHSIKYCIFLHRQMILYVIGFTTILLLSSLFNAAFIHHQVPAFISIIRYPLFGLIFIIFYDFLTKHKNSFQIVFWPFCFGIIYISLSQWIFAYALGITFFQTGTQFSFYGLDSQYDVLLDKSYIAINPNDIGGVSALIFPLIYILFTDDRNKKINKFFLILITFYFLVTMYLTGQKTGMVPIFILILFISFSYLNRKKILTVITLFPLMIYLLTNFFQSYMNLSIDNILNYISSRFSRIDSITQRLDLKVQALELFSSNPIIGAGQDGFQIAYGTNNPHDWNFQVLSESGFIGFLFYFMILFYFIQLLYKYGDIKLLLLSVLIYFTISSAGGSNFSAHPFWVSTAFLIAYKRESWLKTNINKLESVH